jgi:1,4-alpha-glucan branching enzyme/maltooligosyltrehalose trehalohydrolase
MPFGTEVLEEDMTRFRIWAPAARHVHVCLESDAATAPISMERLGEGWFEALVAEAVPGTRYRFMIDSESRVPDPASRCQPEDVHGPSEVIDPRAFEWSDDDWRGRSWEEAVFYELHVGTFTPAGGFAAVTERLDYLSDLGVTAVELMPVADTPGRRNWGYDGVYLFAPEAVYGRPEDLKKLVDAAHRRGLMVFLDVVYNHFGPEGNYLHLYAPQFFTDRHETPWGAAINFDGGVAPVREFFIHNALYWLEEFHIDGLRLDAVHAIMDDSSPDILTELAETVSTHFDEMRHIHLVLENDDNASHYLERTHGDRRGWYVAQWNDDIHHALHVLATGERGGYYEDYADAPARHLGRSLTEGFAYQGEPSTHRGGAPRGTPSAHLPPTAFVSFLQNHDQVGNRAFGDRITVLAEPEAVRAVTAVALLAPSPPLLFMGEEWGSCQPFPFFCDFGPDLADAVREGRRREFARFPEFLDPQARNRIPDPNAESTFAQAVLDWSQKDVEPGRDWFAFHRDLLRLRQREIAPYLADVRGYAGVVDWRSDAGLLARWRLGGGAILQLAANLGPSDLPDAPDPQRGRLIFATHEGMEQGLVSGCWPAWSVAWLLSDGAPRNSL